MPGKYTIDHIKKGPATNRVLTAVAVLEFPSQSIQKAILKQISDKPLVLFEGSTEIKIKPAKTKRQMQRIFLHRKGRRKKEKKKRKKKKKEGAEAAAGL